MGSFSTNEFKSGLKIILENDPYSIVENEMVKPGKGQAFNRVKVRNLKTGALSDVALSGRCMMGIASTQQARQPRERR